RAITTLDKEHAKEQTVKTAPTGRSLRLLLVIALSCLMLFRLTAVAYRISPSNAVKNTRPMQMNVERQSNGETNHTDTIQIRGATVIWMAPEVDGKRLVFNMENVSTVFLMKNSMKNSMKNTMKNTTKKPNQKTPSPKEEAEDMVIMKVYIHKGSSVWKQEWELDTPKEDNQPPIQRNPRMIQEMSVGANR
ncbi:MAG: hypothetical protein QXW98_06145, partial [Candidatus Caldarchaeum sp.]